MRGKFFLLTLIFLFLFPTIIFAKEDNFSFDYIKANDTLDSNQEIEVTGSIYQLINHDSETFELKINNKIKQVCIDKISSISKNSKKIHFTSYLYNINFKNINFYSIVINTKTYSFASYKEEKIIFNLIPSENKEFNIKDLLSNNELVVVSTYIKNEIINNPDNYSDIYKEISSLGSDSISIISNTIINSSNFYIKKGLGNSLYIIYSGREFLIPLNDIINYNTKYSSPKETYDLKTVPLRELAENFGYTVKWDSFKRSVILEGNNNIIELIIGNSNYKLNNSSKTLDSGPLLVDSVTHVPLSFCQQILDLTYSYSISNKSIYFTYIKPKKS